MSEQNLLQIRGNNERGLVGRRPVCICKIGNSIGVVDPARQMVFSMQVTKAQDMAELDTIARWTDPDVPMLVMTDDDELLVFFKRRRERVYDYTQGLPFTPGDGVAIMPDMAAAFGAVGFANALALIDKRRAEAKANDMAKAAVGAGLILPKT